MIVYFDMKLQLTLKNILPVHMWKIFWNFFTHCLAGYDQSMKHYKFTLM